MEIKAGPDLDLAGASARIAATMGLNFPPERWNDLQRGLASAAKELGFVDVASCAGWLASATLTKGQMQVLASHLTVGETYFFREKAMFEALTTSVLPELVSARRLSGERRLRLWSAACCTGEEPYSLAILLSQLIPDLADWNVTILATDINPLFLRKAAAGVYGEWSFRDAPPGLKERYFRRTPEKRYAIRPDIKQCVTFAHLNLVEDVFPALATDTNAMDLIFCRNVLMYFTLPQARKVIANLRRALVEGGKLAVSPAEGSHVLFSAFQLLNYPGAVLYWKEDRKAREEPRGSLPPAPVFAPIEVIPSSPDKSVSWTPPPAPIETPTEAPSESAARPTPLAIAAEHYENGAYAEAAEALLSASAPPAVQAEYSLLVRALANQGQLGEALVWCDRWLAADKLDFSAHYLRAVILQELGDRDQARASLQRAVYLQPEMILAHFALGNLARAMQRAGEADRHFNNALQLLRGRSPNEALPESDGLTAGRLTGIITALLGLESPS